MRYHEIRDQELDEGRDAPLFHFTDIEILSNHILPQNTLKASNPSSARGDGDDGTGKSVSLTRNLKTVFFGTQGGVLILNQTKLAHRYKITPLYGDSPKFAAWSQEKEQEERIYSDITPLNIYLKAIGVALKLPLDDDMSEWSAEVSKNRIKYRMNLLTPILTYSRQYNIPIVLKKSIKMNGTWTQDITQEISDYVEKYKDGIKLN